MENKGKRVQSVEKAMLLLDCFWEERKSYSLAELAAKTGWAKSTIHALLTSMTGNGLVEQDEFTGKYQLGFHAFELGCVVQERWDVKPVAAHYMRKITERTGETLYLGMRCGNELLLIENSEGFNNYKVASPLGGRMPLYGCSQGKILLAYLPKEEQDEYLRTVELKSYTPYTITDPERLRKELSDINAQGYAVEYGELQIGLKSIAAPIFDQHGNCSYAISAVTIARGGVAGEGFQKLQEVVIRAAEEITCELRNPATSGGY